MDKILDVGEVARSTTLCCDVICVEDDFDNDRYGCKNCIFNRGPSDCVSDIFTDKFECRDYCRPDGKDVHFEKYGW